MFYVYVLESQTSGRLYIGFSDNVERRINEHNKGKTTSTKNRGPWVLMGFIKTKSRREAIKLETKLKSFKRKDRVLNYLKKYGETFY